MTWLIEGMSTPIPIAIVANTTLHLLCGLQSYHLFHLISLGIVKLRKQSVFWNMWTPGWMTWKGQINNGNGKINSQFQKQFCHRSEDTFVCRTICNCILLFSKNLFIEDVSSVKITNDLLRARLRQCQSVDLSIWVAVAVKAAVGAFGKTAARVPNFP